MTFFTSYCRFDTLVDPLLCIQAVSRLVDITAGGDFVGLCDEKFAFKNWSVFGGF
jgi:hypothetical protein